MACAQAVDTKNGNGLWQAAVEKKIHIVGIVFKLLEKDGNTPVG